MSIIGWIIIVFIVLGIVITVFEWISEHIIPIVMIAIIITGLVFWPKGTVLLSGVIIIVYLFLHFFSNISFSNIVKEIAENKKQRKTDREVKKDNMEKEKLKKELIRTLPENARSIYYECDEMITSIEPLKIRITDSKMLNAIDDLEEIVKKLMELLSSHPEYASGMKKVSDYYLPTIIDLVGKYPDYLASNVKIAEDIKCSVLNLNEGLKKLLNDMSINEDWDVLSNISVMNQMLEQDGLSEKQTLVKPTK